MGFDLDRLERLAGGLAVIFYVLLFLAFITAVMGSGGGGLLLLVLGAVAHVGRVGLEDFVERRRELGDAAVPAEGDAGERATGLRLKWLPSELRLPSRIRLPGRIRVPSQIQMPRRLELGGVRSGAGLAAARADVRSSFAALVAEIKERPAGSMRRSIDSPHQGVEDASGTDGYDLYDGGFDADDDFAADAENFAVTDSRYEDFEVSDEYEDAGGVEGDYEESAEPGPGFEPELVPDLDFEPEPGARRARRTSTPRSDAPTAQERYEARQRARGERGEAEPIAVAVEAAETHRPQRVQRRQPGGRPDPLRTRRPTRSL
jgi:hypothetical protein